MNPKFLFSIDPDSKELYILHRAFPALLIHVIQNTPVTFRVVDVYDEINREELEKHPCLNEAREWWRARGSKMLDGN